MTNLSTSRQNFLFRGILALVAFFVIFNSYQYAVGVQKMIKQRRHVPYTLPGNIFLGLEKIIKGTTRVGYYSDRDTVKNARDNARFSQAQYALAPLILEENNTQLKYVILDFKNPLANFYQAKTLGGTPLVRNQYGVLLIKNPQAAQQKPSSTTRP